MPCGIHEHVLTEALTDRETMAVSIDSYIDRLGWKETDIGTQSQTWKFGELDIAGQYSGVSAIPMLVSIRRSCGFPKVGGQCAMANHLHPHGASESKTILYSQMSLVSGPTMLSLKRSKGALPATRVESLTPLIIATDFHQQLPRPRKD